MDDLKKMSDYEINQKIDKYLNNYDLFKLI